MCFRLIFILFSCALFPLSSFSAGTRIVVYHTSSRPIFLIGESYHVCNPNEGGNSACREKLKELLGEKDYIVLVEFGYRHEVETIIFDGLTSIYQDAQLFPKSVIENVDVRRALAATAIIFGGEKCDWMDYKEFYDGTCGDKKLAEACQNGVKRIFQCDIDTITLRDVYQEVAEHLESLRKLRVSSWSVSSYWNRYTLYHLLGIWLHKILQDVKDVKSVAAKYIMDEWLPLVQEAERMWSMDNFYAQDGPSNEIYMSILQLGYDSMATSLFEKMMRYDQVPDSRPIVLIADEFYLESVKWFYEQMNVSQIKEYVEHESKSEKLTPFKSEALDMLKDPIEKLESLKVEEVKQSVCVCQ